MDSRKQIRCVHGLLAVRKHCLSLGKLNQEQLRRSSHALSFIEVYLPLSSGISSHAAAALATDKPAQISIMSRNPNRNASRTDSLIEAPVLGLRLAGSCRPASLISPA